MILSQTNLLQNILKTMAPYYAVAKGRNVGIYNSWDDCKSQVNNYSGCVFKKFDTQAEANKFISEKTSAQPQYAGESSGYTSSGYRSSDYTSSGYTSSGYTSSGYTSSGYKSSGYTSSPIAKRSQSQRREFSTTAYDSSRSGERNSAEKRKRTIFLNEDYDVKNTRGEYITDQDGYVNVYTDGACSSNGRTSAKAGIGVWFGDEHPLNVSRPVVGRATNNMAEIQAVTVAAQQAKNAGIKNLKINTDSQFLISCATNWMPKWKRNGWKTASNMPVINKTELLEMEKALEPLNITWNHVNGHVGIHGNEMADKLARAGCQDY